MGACFRDRVTGMAVVISMGLLAFPLQSLAGITFERTYGGIDEDGGRSVQQTQDGGYIVAGWTGSFGAGNYDVYLVKTDSLGDAVWTRTYGGSSPDLGHSVQQTQDGGYIIAGWTWSFGAGWSDVYLVKTDSVGDAVWTRTYGGAAEDQGYSVQQTQDGGYIIAGEAKSFGSGDYDVYLVKTDSVGDTIWTRTYGGASSDYGRSVQQTRDGGYIIGGLTESFGAVNFDVYLVKTDSVGDIVWTRTYGIDDDVGHSVQQTQDGGYIIAGYTYSYGPGLDDVYLVKTDSLGDAVWTRTYGGIEGDEGYSVQQTQGGGYIIAGWTWSFGAGYDDVYLVKTDSIGDSLWARTYGGGWYDEGYSVQQTQDGGYIIAGRTWSFGAGHDDVYLIKTDENGLVARDVAVVSLDAPGDTVFTDSTYAVGATVQNFLPGFPCFDVIATIDSHVDTVRVVGLPPDSLMRVAFDDWLVPSGDSAEYTMAVFVHSLGDTNSGNDSMQKSIFAHEGVGPVILNAEASDNVNLVPGIDADDYVLLTFDEPTTKPSIDALNIGSALSLSTGHSWLDGFGDIGAAYWNPLGTMLMIELSVRVSPPTVAVGDTIIPDGVTIGDEWGNAAVFPVVITGSFSPPGIEEGVRLSMARAFTLSDNHPNPFHHSTTISYSLPATTQVTLSIYDITGRLAETLVNETQQLGIHQVSWDRKNNPSGVYFYRLRAREFTETRKMVVVE